MGEENGEAAGHHRVVVGVDGSPGAHRALAEAVRQASLLGASLDIYSFWHVPGFSGYPAAYNFGELGEAATQILVSAEAEAMGLDPEVPVRGHAEEGVAAHRLVQASSGADLLVVGSRGLGGFTGALLGSVSRYCIEHAHCPVLVVRPPVHHEDAAAGADGDHDELPV